MTALSLAIIPVLTFLVGILYGRISRNEEVRHLTRARDFYLAEIESLEAETIQWVEPTAQLPDQTRQMVMT